MERHWAMQRSLGAEFRRLIDRTNRMYREKVYVLTI